MSQRARGRHPDWPVLGILIVLTVLVGIWGGNVLENRRCESAGGQLTVAGADHICTLGDGRTIAVPVLPSDPSGWVLLAVSLLAIVGGAYLATTRWIIAAQR